MTHRFINMKHFLPLLLFKCEDARTGERKKKEEEKTHLSRPVSSSRVLPFPLLSLLALPIILLIFSSLTNAGDITPFQNINERSATPFADHNRLKTCREEEEDDVLISRWLPGPPRDGVCDCKVRR